MSDETRNLRCPNCTSHDVEPISRIRARVRDRIARFFGWRLYRCRFCERHFYDRRLKRKAA